MSWKCESVHQAPRRVPSSRFPFRRTRRELFRLRPNCRFMASPAHTKKIPSRASNASLSTATLSAFTPLNAKPIPGLALTPQIRRNRSAPVLVNTSFNLFRRAPRHRSPFRCPLPSIAPAIDALAIGPSSSLSNPCGVINDSRRFSRGHKRFVILSASTKNARRPSTSAPSSPFTRSLARLS